jgi:hypothetical protein
MTPHARGGIGGHQCMPHVDRGCKGCLSRCLGCLVALAISYKPLHLRPSCKVLSLIILNAYKRGNDQPFARKGHEPLRTPFSNK